MTGKGRPGRGERSGPLIGRRMKAREFFVGFFRVFRDVAPALARLEKNVRYEAGTLTCNASSIRSRYTHACAASLQIMLWGVLVATVQSRDLFVAYPVSFSLRYLYIRPISRHVCLDVCRSQGDEALYGSLGDIHV